MFEIHMNWKQNQLSFLFEFVFSRLMVLWLGISGVHTTKRVIRGGGIIDLRVRGSAFRANGKTSQNKEFPMQRGIERDGRQVYPCIFNAIWLYSWLYWWLTIIVWLLEKSVNGSTHEIVTNPLVVILFIVV